MSPTNSAASAVKRLAHDGLALAHRPLAAAAYTAGVVKGTAESAAHATGVLVETLIHPQRGPQHEEYTQESTPPPTDVAAPAADTVDTVDTASPAPVEDVPTALREKPGERTLFGGLNTEAAPPMTPGGGGEAFEHEPHAETRDIEHGDAPTDAREVESWADEATDELLEEQQAEIAYTSETEPDVTTD
jgi:hypothetical protein